MESKSEKYVSPGVILPLETNAYKNLKMSATFTGPHADLAMSAVFVNIANPISSIIFGSAKAVHQGISSVALVYSASAGSYITGFQMSGDTDGAFSIYKNGVLMMRFNTNIIVPNIEYQFPTTLLLVPGDVIEIDVMNAGDEVADYQVACIGSFPG